MGSLVIDSKLIGGVLLIIGTSIGGGMLALPVSTAGAGLSMSVFLLVFCWMVMTSGALLILEVNFRLPAGSNMVSMAKSTLGLPGQIIAWIAYLGLLYALLSGYIAGGSDVVTWLINLVGVSIPHWTGTLLFTAIFSWVVYSGMKMVDYVNRGLMFGKLGVYLLLVLLISPHISIPNIKGESTTAIAGSLMVLITSFGFASIVPSLREYFDDDVERLRKVIVYGSLVPLVCYILWVGLIMGVLQNNGHNDVLISLSHSEHAILGLNESLTKVSHNNWISGFFGFFTSICMLTAFLGVSIGLFDFLADGLSFKKVGKQGIFILLLTFLPPLIIVLYNPGIYLHALSYAGVCCVILLLLLPALMAWLGRNKSMTSDNIFLPGGRFSLALVTLVACVLLCFAIISI